MGWSHSIRSTIAVLVSGKTLNMRCFLVRSCMITDSKMLMQDVRSQMKVRGGAAKFGFISITYHKYILGVHKYILRLEISTFERENH